MGVPGYFAGVLRARPSAVRRSQPGPSSRLLVDFNCLVHRQVRGDGAGQTAQEVLDLTVAYLRDSLVASCDLTRGAEVLVAADGPPPLAKMMQQRGRRFVSRYMAPGVGDRKNSADDETRRDALRADPFERTDITPGTRFAERLDATMRRECERLAASGRFSAVTYSGTDEPGEGEQKIMRSLRSGADKRSVPNPPALVYGLDADLLLLTMLHGARTGDWPVVAREMDALAGSGAGDRLCFVDIREVTPDMAGGADPRSVRNHVVCSLLCGNDFLPPASCLSVHDGWMPRLRDMSRDLDLAREDGAGVAVDAGQLAQLLMRLADREDRDFFRADDRYWRARPRVNSAEEAWNSYPLLNKDDSVRTVRPGTSGWRRRFYRLVMGIGHPEDLGLACSLYASGIAWCMAYYSGGHGAPGDETSWFYPHHYGPTTRDLANSVAASCAGDLPVPGDAQGFPLVRFTPDMVRDFVIPPREETRGDGELHAGPEPWSYLFPTRFRMGTYLRHRVWHCAAELPFPLDVTRDVCRAAGSR